MTKKKHKIYGDYIPNGAVSISKMILEELITKIWDKCPNCDGEYSWIYIQGKPPKEHNFQIGCSDTLVCPFCGYKEDITCYNCW